MRSWAVLGFRYSYLCSLICVMSGVSSGRSASLFCSMSSLRYVKISSFHRSVRNMPSALFMPICLISSTTASPTPVLSMQSFVNWKVWLAFAMCAMTLG